MPVDDESRIPGWTPDESGVPGEGMPDGDELELGLDALRASEEMVAGALRDVQATVLSSLVSEDAKLDAGLSAVRSAPADALGDASYRVDGSLDAVRKVVTTVLKAAEKSLDTVVTRLESEGVNWPYDPAAQQGLLAQGPSVYLPLMVPEIADATGGPPPETRTPAGGGTVRTCMPGWTLPPEAWYSDVRWGNWGCGPGTVPVQDPSSPWGFVCQNTADGSVVDPQCCDMTSGVGCQGPGLPDAPAPPPPPPPPFDPYLSFCDPFTLITNDYDELQCMGDGGEVVQGGDGKWYCCFRPQPPAEEPPAEEPPTCPVEEEPVKEPPPDDAEVCEVKCPPSPGAIPVPKPDWMPAGVYWGNPEFCTLPSPFEDRDVPTPVVADPELAREELGLGSMLKTVFQGMDPAQAGVQVAEEALGPAWKGVMTQDGAFGEIQRFICGFPAVSSVLDYLNEDAVIDKPAAVYYGTRLGIATWAERITGFPASYLSTSLNYSLQYHNPQYIPSQSELNNLYVRNWINGRQWECMTRANGNLPYWQQLTTLMMDGKPTPDDLVRLYKRGYLLEPDFRSRMEQQGWKNKGYQDDLIRLYDQWPGLPDQMRFMVRDSYDEEVVKKFGYDTDFDVKFNDYAKQLAAATGVPQEFFKLFWRAHWEIPSNTALTDMFHLLRPDRPAVQQWDALAAASGAAVATAQLGERPRVVTREDVRYAIQVNDMAPTWIQPFIDILYRPITNTDASRAYEIGFFNEDNLYHSFRDNGYSDANAKTLVQYYKSKANRTAANATGVLTTRKIARYYKSGALTRAQSDILLSELIPSADRRAAMLDRIDVEVRAEDLDARVKRVRKKWLTAAIDTPAQLDAELQATGMAGARIAETVARLVDERANGAKHATAAMLCKWRGVGLLDAAEHFRRLRILGYSAADATRISGTCEADILKKAKAEQEKADRQRKKDIREAIAILVTLDPSLAPMLNPLIGKPVPARPRASGRNGVSPAVPGGDG